MIYGTSAGLSATAFPDQLWSQDTPEVEDVADVGDAFGRALAAGDFNGDGFDDLAVGVPGETVGTVFAAGAVNVIYGSAGGLSATVVPDQIWSQDTPDVEDVAEREDAFGSALVAGDFGGGPEADLAVGVPLKDYVFNIEDVGAVNVIYGSPGGLSATATPDQEWFQDSPEIEDTAEGDDRFGYSLAAADLGGSSPADLAVVVPFEDVEDIVDAGAVNVIYGAATGLSATATPDQVWTQDSPDIEDAAEEGDRFGRAVVAANFGRGARADLAVGVPHEDLGATGAVGDAGAVNVIHGSAGGLSATAPRDQFWTQDSRGVQDVAEVTDWFGWALAAANLGGSGHADLAVAAPFESTHGVGDNGAVNVIYGSAGGLSATAKPDQFWTQNSPRIQDEAQSGEAMGWAVTAGNFGGSVHADLAIAASREVVGGEGTAGAVNVIYGSAGGLSATDTPDQLWTQNSRGVEEVAEAFDYFGEALTTVS